VPGAPIPAVDPPDDLLDDFVVFAADAADVLPTIADASVQLVYVDPPFNTGTRQQRRTLRTVSDAAGDRTGFAGRRYATTEVARRGYLDVHDDYLGMLEPLLREARRVLTASGTLYVHLDYREAYRVRLLLDAVFGEDAFLNELVWAYDFGGRARDRWPAKHDTILVYVRTPGGHFFDQDAVERIPYLAPGLVGPEKAARGKLPTDVWWHTIVATNGREKTGYPNQKPEGVLRRVVQASSRPGDRVLDFFAGSGTTGAVAAALGRRFTLVDRNPEAIEVMRRRLPADTVFVGAG
jgi:site-specific DNA-methyltransferase (adenine-specific)